MPSAATLDLSGLFGSKHDDAAAVRDALLGRHKLDEADVPAIREAIDKILEAMQLEALLSHDGYLRQLRLMDAYLERLAAITSDRKRYPDIADVNIEKPIFITGLGRSGTTFLHSLLSRDPDNRCPLVWETVFPSPPPEAATYDNDPRIEQCARYFADDPANPKDDVNDVEMQRKHMNGPLMAEEDNSMLRTSMRGQAMGSGPRILAYFNWILDQDNRPAYDVHKRWLQHLQWRNPRKRWVLKAPTHLHHLEALLSVYPDAQIVMCHRHPAGVISSMVSLLTTYRRNFMTQVDPISYALEQVNYWTSGLRRSTAFRRAHQEVRIFDVGHNRIVANPLGTVEQIYDHFGLEFTSQARTALMAFIADNPQDKHGAHKHGIEYLGFTKARIEEIFEDYIREFGHHF